MSEEQMQPLVSVVVPSYNEERYIRAFLENILGQDYPPGRLEVFIIDGMSSDGTREIIGEYSLRHPEIRLLLNEKKVRAFRPQPGDQAGEG